MFSIASFVFLFEEELGFKININTMIWNTKNIHQKITLVSARNITVKNGIISLTSWSARINTVSKTLYSLLTQCHGFHIVLVLSEEEFPKMMDELPENLKLFVDNELIEVL